MASIGALTTFYSAQTPQITVTDTTLGIRAVNFVQRTETKISVTESGRSVRSSNSTTLWGGTLEFAVGTQSDVKVLKGFIAKARGSLNDFTVIIPGVSEHHGVDNGNPTFTVVGNTAAGATSITVNGTSAGVIAGTTWPVGMVIKFANHSKVYMVTNSNIWSSNSNKTVTIEPPLTSAIVNTEGITYDNVPFKMYAVNDIQEYAYTNQGVVSYRLDVLEAL